eukprot:2037777-Amphidinium_carterae.1
MPPLAMMAECIVSLRSSNVFVRHHLFMGELFMTVLRKVKDNDTTTIRMMDEAYTCNVSLQERSMLANSKVTLGKQAG